MIVDKENNLSPIKCELVNKEPNLAKLKKKMDSMPTNREKIDLFFHFWIANRGRYSKESAKIINSLLAEAQAQTCYYSLGWCYFMLAWLSMDHDEQKNGITLFDQAVKNFSLCGEVEALIRTLNGKAVALRHLGQFAEAITIFNESLEMAQKIDNKELIMTIVGNIATLLIDLRQYEEALEYFSLTELMTVPHTPETAIRYINYGKAYRCLGDLKKAEEILSRSISLCAGEHNEYASAYATLEMGFLRQLGGRSREAEFNFRRCLEVANRKNFPRIKAIALLQLGKIESEKGNADKSIGYLEEAGDIFHQIKASNYEAASLLAISDVYESMGDCAKALATLKKGIKLERAAFNEETINRIGVLKAQQVRRDNLLYKDLYNRIATISQIGQAITSTFDIKKIGAIIYGYMKKLMVVNNLVIGLFVPDEREIIYKIFIENGELRPEFSVKPANGFALNLDNSLDEAEAIIVNRLNENENIKDNLMNLGILKGSTVKSLLVCPLIARNKSLGILAVESEENDSYSSYHIGVIKALAAYLAIAVENEKLFSNLSLIARTDSLTKLANRRRTFEEVAKEFDRYKRYKQPFAVIMADIDKFKMVNDKYGHGVGDTVLRNTAQIFEEGTRTVDLVGRIGGEEFLLLLRNTGITEAASMAERIRKKVAQRGLAKVEGKDIMITISFGVAQAMASDNNFYSTIKRADRALYKVKAHGGNAVGQASI